jgi:hypothetical protein
MLEIERRAFESRGHRERHCGDGQSYDPIEGNNPDDSPAHETDGIEGSRPRDHDHDVAADHEEQRDAERARQPGRMSGSGKGMHRGMRRDDHQCRKPTQVLDADKTMTSRLAHISSLFYSRA